MSTTSQEKQEAAHWTAGPQGPLVSIVIPTYRRSDYLATAIRSAQGQTWPHTEVIVVDDASPEPPVVPNEVRLVRHARNMGAAAARNTGLAVASGEFIIFLDDDDWLAPDRVRWAVDEIGDRRIHACLSAEVYADGSHRPLTAKRFDGDLRASIAEIPPPHVSQLVCRREDVVQMDPTLRSAQDVEWWLRMAHAADFAWRDEVGHFFRIHGGARHDRPPPLDARRVIVLRQWATASAPGRARMAGRLAHAYRGTGHPYRAVWWRLRAFHQQPTPASARQLIGTARELLRRRRRHASV